ncbi:FHA domain-containing protein [Candidatus Nitrotoga sp. BS]|uniref:FHA domain-containing protein n=1 Tax=Candidatus Nitrotoga sp. BS TaxID=2890408 RepID=UPI001EF275E8|nr:FHA domain-containing protein [Candidatus Nitrotoga sp. BS]CAH1197963.1 FHA domain-containing protein [Candidatus Nitrotoga sp. BS]
MAAKLMLSMDGVVLQEYALDKERMTIGRRPSSEIVIDNIAVSGEHAAIVTILNDSFLEDLDSTNGTLVNDVAIKRHFLQNNDVIEIGKYKLKYLNDQQSPSTAADFEKTMVFRASPHIASSTPVKADPSEMSERSNPTEQPQSTPAEKALELRQTEAATSPQPARVPSAEIAPPDSQQAMGVIQILTGPNAGKELELVKNLTTVGKAGLQVVVFTRRPRGYFVTHVEGASYPNLNGKPLDDQPRQLNENDIIELAGIKMEFYLKR